MIYAHAGEIVTCENGHLVCKFGRDVKVGEFFDPSAFECWYQDMPVIGTIDPPCTVCGAMWFHGMLFHFRDGWAACDKRYDQSLDELKLRDWFKGGEWPPRGPAPSFWNRAWRWLRGTPA